MGIEEFLDLMDRFCLSPTMVRTLRYELYTMADWRAPIPLHEMTGADLHEFFKEMQIRKPVDQWRWINSLRLYLKLSDMPIDIFTPIPPRETFRIDTENVEKALGLYASRNIKNAAIAGLIRNGITLAEIENMKIRHVREGCLPGFRLLPPLPEVQAFVETQRPGATPEEYVFLSSMGAPIDGRDITKLLRQAFKKVGIKFTKTKVLLATFMEV